MEREGSSGSPFHILFLTFFNETKAFPAKDSVAAQLFPMESCAARRAPATELDG